MSTYSDLKGGSETTVYSTAAGLPLTGVSGGAQAYVTETNRLYLWNGSGWDNIALINTAPTITTGAAATYTLASDGTATVITLVGTDPEGVPITWSHAVTTGSLGSTAVVTQSANVFTVTPSSTAAHAGTFSLTFTASDGINVATSTSAFTLAFIIPILAGTLATTIYNPNPSSSDNFGTSAILMNDDYYVVGAYNDTVLDSRVYLFNRSNNTLAYTITNPSGASGDRFGHVAAMDGNYLLVSDTNNTRKVYVYNIATFSSSSITSPTYTLTDPNYNSLSGGQYGRPGDEGDLAMSGNYIVISDIRYGSSGAAFRQGIVYVYDISTFSTSTITSANYNLTNPDKYGSSGQDKFGFSVAIKGTKIVAGSREESSSGVSGDGVIYVYDISNFGSSVIASADFSIDNPNYGGGTNSDDRHGYLVAISDDYIATPAQNNDTPFASAGTIYIYNASNGTLLYTIAGPSAATVSNQWFGIGMRLDGNNLYVQEYVSAYSGMKIYHYDIGSFTASTPAVIAAGTGIENTLTRVANGDGWGAIQNFYAYNGKLIVGAALESATNGVGGSVTSSGVAYVYE